MIAAVQAHKAEEATTLCPGMCPSTEWKLQQQLQEHKEQSPLRSRMVAHLHSLPSNHFLQKPRPSDGAADCTLHSGRRELGHEASELSKAPGPLAEGDPARGDASALDLDCAHARAQVGQVFPDGRVDTVKGTVVFKRYYHLFDRGELDSLVHGTPGVRLASSCYDKSNWCVILQKL